MVTGSPTRSRSGSPRPRMRLPAPTRPGLPWPGLAGRRSSPVRNVDSEPVVDARLLVELGDVHLRGRQSRDGFLRPNPALVPVGHLGVRRSPAREVSVRVVAVVEVHDAPEELHQSLAERAPERRSTPSVDQGAEREELPLTVLL